MWKWGILHNEFSIALINGESPPMILSGKCEGVRGATSLTVIIYVRCVASLAGLVVGSSSRKTFSVLGFLLLLRIKILIRL